MNKQWISDQLHPFYRTALSYNQVLVDEQSDFQHIQVVDNPFFGHVLLLDGIIQLTELDNPGYHEMMVNIPMLAHPDPKRVCIVGGGDGGSLQQALRYPSVEQVVVCELDRRVVEVCTQYFPKFGDPFKDKRAKLVIEDAFTYLQRHQYTFEVIIADTTDPVGEAEKLFSPTFYHLMHNALTPNGVIVTQCEQMYFDTALIRQMFALGQELVEHPAYYHTLVPTYPAGNIGCLYLSDIPWTDGLYKAYPGPMNYLNPGIHQAAFMLPEFLKRTLEGSEPHSKTVSKPQMQAVL